MATGGVCISSRPATPTEPLSGGALIPGDRCLGAGMTMAGEPEQSSLLQQATGEAVLDQDRQVPLPASGAH